MKFLPQKARDEMRENKRKKEEMGEEEYGVYMV